MRAREVMSTPVVTARPEATVKEVAELMVEHRVSGIPVVDRFEHLVGIISDSDFITRMEYGQVGEGLPGVLDRLTRLAGANRKIEARTAAELMTTRVITAGPDATVRELAHLMEAHNINRVPIVEAGKLLGIVTRADLLRTMTRHDTAITEDVRWRLGHDLWIDTDGLEISTKDGVVTIAGEVESRSAAALVERWAAATEGVVAVDTHALRYRLDDRHIKVSTDRLR